MARKKVFCEECKYHKHSGIDMIDYCKKELYKETHIGLELDGINYCSIRNRDNKCKFFEKKEPRKSLWGKLFG